MVKVNKMAWGSETIVGCGARVIRLYYNTAKGRLTVDMSQVADKAWDKYQAALAKYGTTKVVVSGKSEKDLQLIIKWWAE